MIKDILAYRAKNSPRKIFIIDKNKKLTFLEFHNEVLDIMPYVNKYYKQKFLGLKINNKIELLKCIIALNRLNKVPIIYPNNQTTHIYLKSFNGRIDITDDDIKKIKPTNKYQTINFVYPNNRTQAVLFTSGTSGSPKACELTYENFINCFFI